MAWAAESGPEFWSEEQKKAILTCADAGIFDSLQKAEFSAGRRIERLEEELRRAIRVRDEFLSIASHELKTPITALRLQLQLTRRGVNPETNLMPSAPKLAAILDLATRQTDRLMHLIEDLLDVARIESGKLDYCFEAVDLSALCEDVLVRFAEQRHVPQLIPRDPGAAPLVVYCDSSRVEQVLINFLTNAFKYGGDKPAEVRVARTEENFLLSVRDFGLGIAKEKQQAIFDRFERAISYEYISGLGLGLYISKQIAEAHGGRISVNSAPGEGSEFTFEIPARRAAN